jgi:hypothetical protein
VILSLSHDAMMPSKQDALAGVNFPMPVIRNGVGVHAPALTLVIPRNASAVLSVSSVVTVIGRAEILQSVIGGIMESVINHWRLLVMDKEPRKAVAEVLNTFVSNAPIPLAVKRASNVTSFDVSRRADKPSEYARIGIVIKDISDRIGYKFRSHSELLLSVVRGAVVRATVTPTLTWETPLAK